MNRVSEAALVRAIIKRLNALPECHAEKRHGSAYGQASVDILACYQGRMVQLEVKLPGNKPTDRQLHTLATWGKAGAIVGVVTSVEEAERLIEAELRSLAA